ncbi:RNA polymerase sigma-70 factor [Pedobacter sp. KBW01]|uniref:RNA polymerase sigma-70 factor n=1 Tax=Pedobacter sp. KBW01 TaxID=2153364 RepID=UPI000F5AE7B0|nr:RNA polymerase sigma-70 factor [Pedobacter sp. KBW01]
MESYKSYTDDALLLLLREGNGDAFSELYDRNWKFLYNSAFNILRHHEDTMDVCQGIFLWIWEHHEKLEIKTNFKSYLFVSAKYKIANMIRDGKVRENLFDGTELDAVSCDDFNLLEVKELKNLIQQLISELPPKCREIFVMSREEAMSHREIAQKLGISEKTVDEQISRALKKLRVPLGKLASLVLLF